MINPTVQNLILFRNADYGETFYFSESGVPLDFTGWTGAAEARKYGGEPGTAELTFTVDMSVGGGGVELTATYENIAAMTDSPEVGTPAEFEWDLRLTAPGGDKEVWMRGICYVNDGVTTS